MPLKLKVTHFDADAQKPVIRRVPVTLQTTFAQFAQLASDRFSTTVSAVTWTDQDGDEITISSEAEWQDMFESLNTDGTNIRLAIVSHGAARDTLADTATPTSRAPSAESSEIGDYEHIEHDNALAEVLEEQDANLAAEHAPVEDPADAPVPETAPAEESPSQDPPEAPLPHIDGANPNQETNHGSSQRSPPSLADFLATLPDHAQAIGAQLSALLANPSSERLSALLQAPAAPLEDLPAVVKGLKDEVAKTVNEVLAHVRTEADVVRADYERFKREMEVEKERLARELEERLAEAREALAQSGRSGDAGTQHDEASEAEKETLRQQAREMRKQEREAERARVLAEVKKGKQVARSEVGEAEKPAAVTPPAAKPSTRTEDDFFQRKVSLPGSFVPGPQPVPRPAVTSQATNVNARAGPSGTVPFMRIPGSFHQAPSQPAAPSVTRHNNEGWSEVTPAQLKKAVAKLGFDPEADLGTRIACERAWELNRGLSLEQLVQATVELLV